VFSIVFLGVEDSIVMYTCHFKINILVRKTIDSGIPLSMEKRTEYRPHARRVTNFNYINRSCSDAFFITKVKKNPKT
jgi:hypothetical protein